MTKRMIMIAALFVTFIGISASGVCAQDRGPDKEVRFQVKFAKGRSSSTVRKQIRLGTTHLYTLRARRGQNMRVVLTTGNQTSFTVFSPSDGIIEDADGVKRWNGTLSESGEYLISIGTDKTANYTLEISIRN
ncbi:MAG: hypothetical protein R2681_00285 [Pyrinomonadaceae bacterium]